MPMNPGRKKQMELAPSPVSDVPLQKLVDGI
jgi:hypothetical protein